MIWYTADLHLGHYNVIRFDNRPFESVEEMDRVLIENWNNVVKPTDEVYIIGDLIYKSGKSPMHYLSQLNGNKFLILGNHDGVVLKDQKAKSCFKSIDDMKIISDTYNGEKIRIHLCHYPLAEWSGMYRDAWHVYGHIHNNKHRTWEIMKDIPKALNAGVCIHNYRPVSFAELVENNSKFNES